MMRTTIYIPESLHQRLHLASGRDRKSLSQIVTDLLDEALAKKEDRELDEIYQGFEALKGIAGTGGVDASTTINELLYGEHGAWQANQE